MEDDLIRECFTGESLLQGSEYADAEVQLRECLQIQLEKHPDDWRLFQAKSMLGEALAGQERLDEAETLLLEGFKGMKSRDKSIPRPLPQDMKDASSRLITFYTQTNRPEEVARWQAEIELIEAEIKRLLALIDASEDASSKTPQNPSSVSPATE